MADEPYKVEKTFPAAASDDARLSHNAGLAPRMVDVPCAKVTHSRGTMVILEQAKVGDGAITTKDRIPKVVQETYKIVSGVEESAERWHPKMVEEVAKLSKNDGPIASVAEQVYGLITSGDPKLEREDDI